MRRFDAIHSAVIILVCELINELKAWNIGSIKKKRMDIEQTHYKTMQNEEGIKLVLSEALKVTDRG